MPKRPLRELRRIVSTSPVIAIRLHGGLSVLYFRREQHYDDETRNMHSEGPMIRQRVAAGDEGLPRCQTSPMVRDESEGIQH